MLYLFWVARPPFGLELFPLLACWECCQMFYQPIYVVKEWEVAEVGECPFCRLTLRQALQLRSGCTQDVPQRPGDAEGLKDEAL